MMHTTQQHSPAHVDSSNATAGPIQKQCSTPWVRSFALTVTRFLPFGLLPVGAASWCCQLVLMTLCHCPAGGGAVEGALSIYLENFATTLGSREQLAIAEFADALLVRPCCRCWQRWCRVPLLDCCAQHCCELHLG